MNVSGWNVSAASNNAAPPDGAPEGWLASQVNDVVRECMAAVARWYQDSNGKLVTGGAGNAYTLTTNSSFQAFSDLSPIAFRLNRANTGAATLNIDGLGAKSMRVNGRALVSGQLIADTVVVAIYNSEDDAFDLLGVPGNAADLVGTVADARLSSNVALRNSTNTFDTGSTFVVMELKNSNAGGADLRLTSDSADENNKTWAITAENNSGNRQLRIRARNDNGSHQNSAIVINGTSSAITSINLLATAVQANGSEVATAATACLLAGTQTITGAKTFSAAPTFSAGATFTARPRSSGAGGFLSHASSDNTGGSITVSTNDPSGTPADGDIWIKRDA